jgi:hypothetical protein
VGHGTFGFGGQPISDSRKGHTSGSSEDRCFFSKEAKQGLQSRKGAFAIKWTSDRSRHLAILGGGHKAAAAHAAVGKVKVCTRATTDQHCALLRSGSFWAHLTRTGQNSPIERYHSEAKLITLYPANVLCQSL